MAHDIEIRRWDSIAGFLSEPALLQLVNQLHIEFPDVETRDILAVEVYYVCVGDSAASRRVEYGEVFSPGRGGERHKSVVVAVEFLHDRVGEVQRKPPGP